MSGRAFPCSRFGLLRALPDLDRHGIPLRLTGRAAAVGDVFFQQLRESSDDLRMAVLQVLLLADIAGQIEHRHGRQSARITTARPRRAPGAGSWTERELETTLPDGERAVDRMM